MFKQINTVLKEVLNSFFIQQGLQNVLFGILIVIALMVSLSSDKFMGVLILFGLFVAPVLVFGSFKPLVKVSDKAQKLIMLVYLPVVLVFAIFPQWLLAIANYLGLLLIFVLAIIPFLSLFKALQQSITVKKIIPIVLLIVVYGFLFLSSQSFFWKVINSFFGFSADAFAKAGIKPNLYFALCAVYMAYYYWQKFIGKTKN